MPRPWGYVCVVLLLSSPALAGDTRGARTSLDRVPAEAERIAAAYGVITSAYRSVAHNRDVGGVPDSYHLSGRAIDVARRPGVTHAQIALALKTAGYVLIESLDEHDHSHFAFAPALAAATHAASDQASPAPTHPWLAADEHGSLVADLNSGSARVRSRRRSR